MRAMLFLRGALLGLVLTGSAAIAQTTPPAPPGTAPAKAPSAVVTMTTTVIAPTVEAAKVNTEAIYEVEVQRALDRVPVARRAEERPRLLAYLIENLLIDQSLRSAGYKADPAEVEKRVAEMKSELKKVGKEFDKMLADMKVTEPELRRHIAADLRWNKYAETQATTKVLTDLFTSSKDTFDGSAVNARHILIVPTGKDDKAAEAALVQTRQLKKTIETEVDSALAKLPTTTDKLAREKARTTAMIDSFAKYAREKSGCPTKNQGGEVGWFQKSGIMVAAFSTVAFQLQPFQISDAVKTPFGYHLILVTERKAGRDVKFEDVKEIVKEVYFDRLHEGLSAELRKKATIVIHPAPK